MERSINELLKIAKELQSDKWIETPAIPGTGKRDGWNAGFGPNDELIEGYIGNLPITTKLRGLIQKVSKKTKMSLERVLAQPEIQQALEDAGIRNIHIEPTSKKWTMYHNNGSLGIHPRTVENIERSPIKERRDGGIERVIHHEAGHGFWKHSTQEQKDNFIKAIKRHPEIKEMVGKIVSLKALEDTFHESSDRAERECHAELHAVKKYAPQIYNKLPNELKDAIEAISSKKVPKLPSHLTRRPDMKWM